MRKICVDKKHQGQGEDLNLLGQDIKRGVFVSKRLAAA